jgi:hypothetical protein
MVVIYDLVGWIILKNRLARTLITPHCRGEEVEEPLSKLIEALIINFNLDT